MMYDPNANYYETVKAFRDFWKKRVLPEEPFEDRSADKFEQEVGLNKEKESEREKEQERAVTEETLLYAAQVRAFKGWYYSVKPWVRSDGTIVSKEERQKILDAQRKELEIIENKNEKK